MRAGYHIGGLIASALSLAGCAGMNYAMENYNGVKVEDVGMPDDTYRVFDKPTENRMMITPSVAAAAGIGFAGGASFGAVDGVAPRPRFEAAALQYLREVGRGECQVREFYLIVKPQYEIKYDCPNAPMANPPARPKPPPRVAPDVQTSSQ